MSDIFVMIRNQANNALTSIDGIPFLSFLERQGQLIAEETIELIYADAGFDDLPVGEYTVGVRHERVEPPKATCPVSIASEDEVVLVTFVYLEPERVLLTIHVSVEKRL
ncbi:hypothetical protein NW813_07635 [Synechococcus sp. R55.6]|uniref:hypothetical protein n=1 Tax=unclassified Synechococcus TaxID=2626047 RepID=UPI0039C4D479